METNITISNPGSSAVIKSVTADEINDAFTRALTQLTAVSQATRKFAEECATVGDLLKSKRAEFPPRAGWYDWLIANCPNISRNTADRLIGISDLYRSGGNAIALPARLESVRTLFDALQPEPENKADDAQGGKATQAPSKLISAMSRFWGAITRKQPTDWDEMERHEFLIDLAKRESIRREQGWKTIDVEAETI